LFWRIRFVLGPALSPNERDEADAGERFLLELRGTLSNDANEALAARRFPHGYYQTATKGKLFS
jgi:hypothetical protein